MYQRGEWACLEVWAPAMATAPENETSLQVDVATKRVAELDETRKNNAEVVEKLEKELQEATAKAASTSVDTVHVAVT